MGRGMMGRDPIMFYENMGTYVGPDGVAQQINVAIQALPANIAEGIDAYEPRNPRANKLNGKFGQINLKTGTCSSSCSR